MLKRLLGSSFYHFLYNMKIQAISLQPNFFTRIDKLLSKINNDFFE